MCNLAKFITTTPYITENNTKDTDGYWHHYVNTGRTRKWCRRKKYAIKTLIKLHKLAVARSRFKSAGGQLKASTAVDFEP